MTKIGVSFENVSAEEVISNYKFYASQLLDKKIISFRGIELDKYSHHDLLHFLGNGGPSAEEAKRSKHLDSNLETIEAMGGGDSDDFVSSIHGRGHVISKRRHVNLENQFLELSNAKEFFEWSIHVDTPLNGPMSENKNIQAYTSMYMNKFDYAEGVGNTYFLSMIEMFEKCPHQIIQKLYSAEVDELRKSGDGRDESKLNTWPALHKHPVTGEPIFFYPTWSSIVTCGDEITHDISLEIQDWVRNYFLDKENWYTWSWKKDDFIMWDNRSLVHRFEGGWSSEKRIFSQGGLPGLPPQLLSI